MSRKKSVIEVFIEDAASLFDAFNQAEKDYVGQQLRVAFELGKSERAKEKVLLVRANRSNEE